MSLVILKELEYYTANVASPYNNSDLIIKLGLENDIKRYNAIIKELNNTTFLKHRKPAMNVEELSSKYDYLEDTYDAYNEISEMETFQFTYVGIIIIMGVTIVIYPKYIGDIKLDQNNNYLKFKQIIKVIYQYKNKQEQTLTLSTNEKLNQENQLGIAIQILSYYRDYGLYQKEEVLTEINGDGEINWYKTVNELPLFLSGKSPVYIAHYTDTKINDDLSLIRQIQISVLNNIKKEFNDILLLLGFNFNYEDSEISIDLDEEESLIYYLEKELTINFMSHKIELITLLILYIQSKNRSNKDRTVSAYGVTKFDRIWEDVCKVVYGNDLEYSLEELGLMDENKKQSSIKLKDVVQKPIWINYYDNKKYSANKTLELDVLHINRLSSVFEIYDSKYYLISFDSNGIKGQPGVSDITKQYLYEQAFTKLAKVNNYSITNKFIVPKDELFDDSEVGIEIAKVSLPIFDSQKLSPIVVLARDCQTIFNQYLELY